MPDRKAVEARIAELRGELARAEGTPTEVYSRIVGYYRSVRNWNAGKREEYGQRLAFGMPDLAGRLEAGAEAGVEAESRPSGVELPDEVLVFTREACPNCPPVADYVAASGIRARFVDVDLDDGLALARELGVMATPTVLGLDGEGRESFRAFDVAGLAELARSAPSAAAVAR